MGSGIYFPACSLLYSIMLLVLVLNKKNKKNKLYKALVITNFVGLIIELFCTLAAYNITKFPLISNFILKLYLVYLNSWICLFTLYIYRIANQSTVNNKKDKVIKRGLTILYALINVAVFVLPIYLVNKGEIRYTYGPSVYLIYVISLFFIICCLISMFMGFKNVDKSKYSPLFIFISGGTFAMIIQSMYPSLLLITSIETFVTFLIYFTIESEIKYID